MHELSFDIHYVLTFWFADYLVGRSSPPEVFIGKDVLKICSKLIGHPCWSHTSALVFSCKMAAYFLLLSWINMLLRLCISLDHIMLSHATFNPKDLKKLGATFIRLSWYHIQLEILVCAINDFLWIISFIKDTTFPNCSAFAVPW